MKSEIKDTTLVAVDGVPTKLSTSGRLQKGEKYRIIGFYTVPAKKDEKNNITFAAWDGVLIEKLSTGAQIMTGTNTLLGTSVIFVGVGSDGASAKGYKVLTVSKNCFTSPADFAHKANGDDNGTIFEISDIENLMVNENFKPSNIEISDTNFEFYTKLKAKQFYQCKIVKEEIVKQEIKESV